MAFIRLNQLSVGSVITEELEKDLRLIMGEKIKMDQHEILFKNGEAFTASDIFKSITMDGRDILVKPKGKQ